MTMHLGSVPASSTLYIPFATYGGTNGESITLTGLAVTDIEIYKNGSVTQRASDAGYALLDTDGIDFDGVTGIHGFSIDLSDNTDAGFYAVGSTYWVVVSAVTVDSQTVNFIAATFRIGPAETVTGYQPVDVGAISGDATAANNAESFFDGTGYAGTNNVIPTVGAVTGAVGSVTGNVGGNVTGSVGSVTGSIGSLGAQAKLDVNAEADTALADYDAPTNAEMVAAFTEIKGATWATTDTLEAIRDRGDSAWLTATSVTVSDKTGFSLSSTGLDLVTAWTTDITGSLSGSVGSVTTKTGYALSATGLDLCVGTAPTAIPVPGTTGAADILAWLAALSVNKSTANNTTLTVYEADGSTALATSTISYADPLLTRGAMANP